MDNTKATVTLFHDTRRSKKNGICPVKLTIYFDGQKKRYNTGVDLSKNDWIKINQPNLRDDRLKTVRRKLNMVTKKAEDIIDKLESFSYTGFESGFFKEKTVRKYSDLQGLFDRYIQQLEDNDQIGTAISYRTTINSIKAFRSGLKVSDVTVSLLLDYERHMRQKNISPSTIGIYLRQLRRIINVAINDGLLSADKYPFKGYSIPASRNIKKALNENQIISLLNYETRDLNKRRALDFWLFSYISNGINMADVCLLTKDRVQGDFFHYFRSKTKNTKKRDLRPIKVPLTSLTQNIILRWGNPDSKSSYVFPILEEGLTAKQIKYKVQDFIYFVNKHMKGVAVELGIEENIGTYVARHSHSTILKRRGVPTEFIKENLGHASVLTTENYLDDFADGIKMKYADLLTDFNIENETPESSSLPSD